MFQKIWTNIFYVIAVGFLGLFAYLVLQGSDGQWPSILAAVVALIGAKMNDLLKIKLSPAGIEAEMRSLIDEAKVTLEQLHLLAINQSKILLESVQSAGRWGGGATQKDKELMRDSIVATLNKLGVGNDKIAEVLSVERRYVHFDYAHAVTRSLSEKLAGDKKTAWNDFFSKRQGIGFEPGPDELESFLESVDLLDQDIKERLEDYRYYDRTSTHRQPDNVLTRRG